jgi:hypothetical protein
MVCPLLSFGMRTKVRLVFAQLGSKSLMRASVKRRHQGKRKLVGRSAQFLRAPQQPGVFFGQCFVAKHRPIVSALPSRATTGSRLLQNYSAPEKMRQLCLHGET